MKKTLRSSRRGSSIVEVLVSIVILAIGVLGISRGTTAVAKQMADAERQVHATRLAQSRFERLREAPTCAAIAQPGQTIRGRTEHGHGIVEHWTVTGGRTTALVRDSIVVRSLQRAIILEDRIPCR